MKWIVSLALAARQNILLNCAISRNGWGMGPGKKDPILGQLDAGLPCTMEIDYVRVYSGMPDL